MFVRPGDRSARGQMIVIVALALTALVAMAGLVIDGGMAWSNRRQVQNAADAASLAGARVLALDLKYRAANAGNPTPPPAPFTDPDTAVCDAINDALVYNTNGAQVIPAIDCYAGSDDAVYTDFDGAVLGRVGDGVPFLASGVRVLATGQSETMLMRVVGITTIDVTTDARAVIGPQEPVVGNLMPFVFQNPLGPLVPGQQYEVRSENDGDCDTTGSLDRESPLADAFANAGLTVGMVQVPSVGDLLAPAAPGQPQVPVANPNSTSFVTSVTVRLSAVSGAKIYYTTDSTTPTTSSTQYSGALTFTETTQLKAIAVKSGKSSDVGTYEYTRQTPPDAVTATPGNGEVFDTEVTVTLSTATPGATIYYTTNGSDPTTASSVYAGPLTFSATTQLRAIAHLAGSSSAVSIFNYILDGDTEPPVANPVSGTEFETSLVVTLSSPTAGATIYYTTDGSDPTTSSNEYISGIGLVSTTTIKAIAVLDGLESPIATFDYVKLGPVCPELTSGNFGWVDFSGGSNSNADLIDDIEHPENAEIDWYYRVCSGSGDTNCRDIHDASDPADDHWRIEGTPGNRNVALRTACDLYGPGDDGSPGKIIYVPIWDSFEVMGKKPNGNNAVFHLIGFAAFRLDGIIDNKNNGDPSNDACGKGLDFGGTPNDKGFIGTYVDSFVGTQVAPCIPSEDGTSPCANLGNDAVGINLAD